MAGTSTPIFPQTVITAVAQILPADASNLVSVLTGGANGTKIESICVSSSDTSTRVLQFYVTRGGVDYLIGTVNAPINAGNIVGTPSIDVLRDSQFGFTAYDPNGNKYLYLNSTDVLKIKSTSTLTAGKAVQVFASGGAY